jgi:hypothetical protein
MIASVGQQGTVTQLKAGELRWAPIAVSHRIPYTGTNYPTLRGALEATFGPFPIKLRFDEEYVQDANVLRGMAAASAFPCYRELYEALIRYHALLLTDT